MLAMQRQLLAFMCFVIIAFVRTENPAPPNRQILDKEIFLHNTEDDIQKTHSDRETRSFTDAHLREAAEALTDDEITNIIKSITFPNNEENITEDVEAADQKQLTSTRSSANDVEPRTRIADGEGLPIAGLHLLSSERSANGASDSRMISRKTWIKYIRRLMRQIRRGTRKIQRKTRVKKLKEEPTLESFLHRMYVLNQKQRLKHLKKKKTSSWFLW